MYKLMDDLKFKIDNYCQASPFSSFLPGLAGEDGIPMWVYYVNRGQAIASFGVENKDNAMTEFYPADKAYQVVPLQGFRTFIKGKRGKESFSYEPFNRSDQQIKDSMIIDSNVLELSHENKRDKLKIDIAYYNLPHQSIPGFIREVTIKNDTEENLTLELLDGLATILPAKVNNDTYKSMSHTLKSWFDVELIDQKFGYYFLRGSTEDEAAVSQVEGGNFYISLLQTGQGESIIPPLYDRNFVFGGDSSLRQAEFFQNNCVTEIDFNAQIGTNKTACAFSPVYYHFKAHEEIKLFSVIGQVENKEQARRFLAEQVSSDKFKSYRSSAVQLTKELTDHVETQTALPHFDAYVKQNYLDNGLRGGFPLVFENETAKQIFYLYSRKHGDLERDYNYFSISPSYYSQGNGNYRDMNQNRRLDVLFDPRVGDSNIKKFVNLIQLDGYNPLAIKTVQFTLKEADFDFGRFGIKEHLQEALKALLLKGYTPGDVKRYLDDNEVNLTVSFEVFLTSVLTASDEVLEAEHGEGFWIDHWTYNLDLIDTYLAVYPDKKSALFFADGYRYFDSPAFVNTQDVKYVEGNGKVRQYNALTIDEIKISKQASGAEQWLRTNHNQGQIFTTNLFSKLFLLATNKSATIAPFGLGIEMEAGKPGWNDALNGLPGMFGAGVSELYELKRLLNLLKIDHPATNTDITLPVEAGEFIKNLTKCLESIEETDLNLELWQAITTIRERYRASIKSGITGKLFTCTIEHAIKSVKVFEHFVDLAIDAVEAFNEDLVPTYFYFDVELSPNSKEVKSINPHAVLPFLEGIVKQLKLSNDPKVAKKIYGKVKKSDLYDRKLGMYKTSVSIKTEPIELGRAKFFTPGWLENESVFLHMSYKYLLELLKNELYDEFFEEIKTGLVLFNDPKKYGRSILENSSFIASSANPDPLLHGKGFIARLSGATVEFLHMWFSMFVGQKPFSFDDQVLSFELSPKLPSWLFDQNGQVQFKLFSQIDVTYENIERKDTYGTLGVKPVKYTCLLANKKKISIDGSVISGDLAEQIRAKEVQSIHVQLA
ncbi:hypothetical protein [Amphibacillus indicireducens]|uniref:Cellobiose phosphorylase n=1 Tax=Amphibacillus indicireducens TaxID=1076330 RepID=A0ABP7W4K1_9BACI